MQEKKYLHQLTKLTGVSIRVYDRSGKLQLCLEKAARVEQQAEQTLSARVLEQLRTNSYVLERYPGRIPVAIGGIRGEDAFYLIGPFAYGPVDSGINRQIIWQERYQPFPKCQIPQALLIMNLIRQVAGGDEISVEEMEQTLDTKSWQMQEQGALVREEVRQMDLFLENHPLEVEEKLLYYVEHGEPAYLQEHFWELFPIHPVILEDIHKNEEYMAVIAISIAARAAIRGGLSSRDGFLINDIYLKKLAACKDLSQMNQIILQTYIHCAKAVRSTREAKAQNRHIAACKKLLIARRFEKINLQEIADELGVSKDYLQKLFRKCEGVPITSFIRKMRLEAACNLLKYSGKPIGEIAAYLQFETQSYFCRVFKASYGITPLEYRNQYEWTSEDISRK